MKAPGKWFLQRRTRGANIPCYHPRGRCREIIKDFNPQTWVTLGSMANPWTVGAIDNQRKVRASDLRWY